MPNRHYKRKAEKDSLSNLSRVSKKTVQKGKIPKWSVSNVEEFKKNQKTEIIFSFKFYDRVHKAFNLGGLDTVCDRWFVELLDCLKEVSTRTWAQLSTIPKFKAHPHDFRETNFKYELFDGETLEQLECVQFSISKSYGRVHGFLIDNCFYVYWLDPHHNMYDSEGYGGVREFNSIKGCYEILSEHNAILIHENEKLKNKIQNLEENMDEDSYSLLEELIEAEERIKLLEESNDKLLLKCT